jgi:mono/diheme cytochrome c family protein
MSLQRFLIGLSILCLGVVMASLAQEKKTEVKKVPAPATNPASGKEMFKTYCAPCHGEKAKGEGPAASALKNPPADLTALAKNNGGKFPAERVASILRGQGVTAHGSKEMPVWGPVFWQMSHGHETEVQQRVRNLTHYIETLQEK